MKKGFTLIEMLVVIGIIAVLLAATLGVYSGATKAAERCRCQELVANTATALTALFQKNGSWPKALREKGATDGELDAEAALPLAKGGFMSLTLEDDKLAGLDKFGIVTPKATAYLKSHGTSVSLNSKVQGEQTLQDHILHYALDLDGDGVIEGASVGGESVDIRATAAVWFCAKDKSGNPIPYSRGVKGDGVYSWTYGQTQGVR